jgi:GTP-binding protein EngB required for normal cell division
MNKLFQLVKEACINNRITSLDRNIEIVENLLSRKRVIDVAVLGQFKAGKSSFLNSFLGKQILPIGVVPVTSVITRIGYGEYECAQATFIDGRVDEIPVDEIDEYVSEVKNPENIKKVLWVDVYLPTLKQFEGLRFVDTPGLGSIFRHNSEATEKWAPEIGVAIVAIGAERPLSEDEIHLIREIGKYSPDIVILLTKVDLFDEGQIDEVMSFVESSLRRSFNRDMPLYRYSTKRDSRKYGDEMKDGVFIPLMRNFGVEFDKIVRYKTESLARACLGYLELGLSVSRKSDVERSGLMSRILSERLNIDYIRKELLLLMTSFISRTRENIFQLAGPYRRILNEAVAVKFIEDHKRWRGNLFALSRTYEKWLHDLLSSEIGNIVESERPNLAGLLEEAKRHFSFFLTSFRERLNHRIQTVLGISMQSEEWVVEIREIRKPDIRISRASEFHLDLLWFLFPMFLFKRIFMRHFANQVPHEIEKNLHRVTSDLTGMVNRGIEELKDQTYRYIVNELSTIEMVLSNRESRTDEILRYIELIGRCLKDG